MDVVVVGAGTFGASLAWMLARAGETVTLVDQFEPGDARATSGGESRLMRCSHGTDAAYTQTAHRARALWRELEAESGEAILSTTGSLDLGPGTDERVAALSECDVAFALEDGADLASRYPLRIEGGVAALLQPDGGVLNAARAHGAFLALARRGGAQVFERARVLAVEGDGHVRLEGGSIEAQAVVVTAGAWVSRLLEPLGISPPVTPTRETVAYFPAPTGLPTIIDWRVPEGYALPRPGDSVYALPSPEGLKVGVHRTGPPTDPDEEGAADPEAVRGAADWVAEHVEGADPTPLRTETCLYTNMPDQSFVVERQGRLVVGSPCSGHGFKFAPLVGRELAGLAAEVLA
jgi:sarcosine oxidase